MPRGPHFLLFACIGFALSLSFLASVYQVHNLSFAPWTKFSELFFGTLRVEKTYPDSAIFVGDVMLARDVERKIRLYKQDPFAHTHDLFTDATYVVGNFEAAIPEHHTPTKDNTFIFSVDSDLAARLKPAGFTHLSLANNHSLDFGESGYAHTRSSLASSGLTVFGHEATTSLDISVATILLDKQAVAIVGINFVTKQLDVQAVTDLVATLEKQTNQQLVYVHWGNEYQLKHTKQQEELAHALIEAGADAVIGNHPHVAQDIEVYEGVPIFYSLGNFVFDQYFSQDVQEGLMLTVSVVDTKLQFTLTPITSLGTPATPREMEGQQKDDLIARILRTSSPEVATYFDPAVLAISPQID